MLANSELFLQAIEEFGLIMLNAEGYIQWANNSIFAITGYQVAELTDQPFSILFSEEDRSRKRSDDELFETLKTGKRTGESWKLRKDGSRFWAGMSITPVYNRQQELTGFAVVLNDNTVRKQAELELRQREERYRL